MSHIQGDVVGLAKVELGRQQHEEFFADMICQLVHMGVLSKCVMNFLTVVIPPSVNILEWVSVVHTSYWRLLQLFKSCVSTVVLSG
jgi:hypothetical protein